MDDRQMREAAKIFAEYWKDRGYEKGESQPFWLSFLRDVLGVEHPEEVIHFESQVKLDNTSFIDGIIESTHVLIEQKSVDKDLRKGIRQSDGSFLNPFQQAKRYSAELPYSQRPRWIITCNFKEFFIYDMEKPTGEPEHILLSELPKEYYRFKFMVETGSELLEKEKEISIKAGEIVGLLYDELLKQYHNPDDENTLKSMNKLCVRLVFCLYAEDSGLFGKHLAFHDYLKTFAIKDVRRAVIDLFKVLNTKPQDRDPYLDEELAAFPYVNGGLFEDENIEIPFFNERIVNLLLKEASANFDWSEISPTIFGALFESTLNPETRHDGGMHYTSIENIHKVIDPLFLDALKEELHGIQQIKVERTRNLRLDEYREKLSRLTFLDPACGSGNFLTETYICLRRLENEAISDKHKGNLFMDFIDPIKVSIRQFYGIEINDFAVTVAKTALWIAESQMMKETEAIINSHLEFLPLKSYANIIEGNALELNWDSVISKQSLSYIMGNPPFLGGMMMNRKQKSEIATVLTDIKGVGEMDYVVAWYYKAAELMEGTTIRAAFVSTNSICQGQQAVTVWKPLFERGIKINFAHKTFIWDSEAVVKAHVHCVIVGFSYVKDTEKYLYDNGRGKSVKNINSYLIDAPTVFVESRSTPLCDVPAMSFGNMPRDGGGFILSQEERDVLIRENPLAEKWVRLYIGAEEFINKKIRYCLWLKGANPAEIKQCSLVMKRIAFVRNFRLNSKAAATRRFGETPTLFCQITQPVGEDYLLIPCVSSERRKYVPIGFMDGNVIASNLVQIIPNSSLFHFGVLTSNVHNAWMRAVCGRLKSDYRYSKDIVYNNFPWCTPSEVQKARIIETAKGILAARALYPDCSLAELYDELTMPPELRKAHQENDRAVMHAYNFPTSITESECVDRLMRLYVQTSNRN